MIYLELLALAVIVVFAVDISGLTQSIRAGLTRWRGVRINRLKPFDCSLCMVWWAGIAYLLVRGELSLFTLCFVALLAMCTLQIGGAMQLFRDAIDAALQRIFEKMTGYAQKR
ncbi:hypothetical protein [Alistipes sp.]|uniref:hypothetical protein n=1 Tax=Alistipes sp. TaxID=1872444 RepID=UPI003AF0B404